MLIRSGLYGSRGMVEKLLRVPGTIASTCTIWSPVDLYYEFLVTMTMSMPSVSVTNHHLISCTPAQTII